MIEAVVERHFVRRMREERWEQRKFTSPGRRHVVDRIVALSRGVTWWVELKRPGEKPRPGQVREHKRLMALGHLVTVLESKDDIDVWILNRRLEGF